MTIPDVRTAGGAPLRRAAPATVAAVLLLAGVTAVLEAIPGVGLDTVLLVFLPISVTAAAVGGPLPAAVGVLCSAAAANWFFAAPRHSLWVRSPTEAVDLVAFVFVTTLVVVLSEIAARARVSAERQRVVSAWSAGVDRAGDPVSPQRLMEQARDLFGVDELVLLEGQRELLRVGHGASPDASPFVVEAQEGVHLLVTVPPRVGLDKGLLGAAALTIARAYRTGELRARASRVEELAQLDRTKTALLAAVSHDLRTPLAGIKACVGTLREDDIVLDESDRVDLLAEVEAQADRLTRLIDDLLAMSRIQAGAVHVAVEPTSVPAVLGLALGPGAGVQVQVPQDTDLVSADPGLLERVFANVVENAVKYGEGPTPVVVTAVTRNPWLTVSVIDHGRGVDALRREQIFEPFQRLDDHSTTGTGLGLAIARGFVEAMGGTIRASQTPGGGLTMTIQLRLWTQGGKP